MSDVFISYARSSAQQAQFAAAALRSLGYSVWIDDDVPAHRAFTDVIQEQLNSAKSVFGDLVRGSREIGLGALRGGAGARSAQVGAIEH